MAKIKCCVNDCKFNDGRGKCEKREIFISDAETGQSICQDYEEDDSELQKNLMHYNTSKGGKQMDSIANAKILLNYYMRKSWEASGLLWDSDNESDIDSMVDAIVEGVKQEILTSVERENADA